MFLCALITHSFLSIGSFTCPPTHSDHRFTLLFRAVDSIGGDGSLEEEELVDFMFPGSGSQASDLEDPAHGKK